MVRNGSNGYHMPDDPPDGPSEDLLAGKSRRGDLRMIEMAVKRGWLIPSEAYEQLPAEAMRIAATSNSERERIGAIKCVIAMHASNLDGAVALDKAKRLDSGEATERVENRTFTVRFDDRG